MHRYIVLFLLCGSFLFFRGTLYGQQSPSDIDFATVNVDNLSDEQIQQLLQKGQAAGLSVDQICQQAALKGLPQDQVDRLKTRLEEAMANGPTQNKTTRSGNDSSNNYSRQYQYKPLSRTDSLKMLQDERDKEFRKKIYGADLFSNANLTFEPNLNIATPGNYIIGPGDELVLEVFGYSEKSDRLKVSPDGYINVQNVGPILVSGLSIDDAKILVSHKLQAIYSSIITGNTHVQLLLGNIRSIRVMVIGEIMRPGSYTLPSLATVANALYVSGGPDINGSFRDIQVVRNGKPIVTFDLYDFLAHGSLGKNVLLQDQDIVKVYPYKTRLEIKGEVKHPAIFEAKDGESLDYIISNYAGGYTSKAYKGNIRAERVNDQEREILTVAGDSAEHFQVHSGDVFYVDSILNRYTNRVNISGSVFHPGDFALDSGMTVKQLITKADGITEDAFMPRGLIKRLKPDFSDEVVSFNLADVLSGVSAPALQKNDSVFIYSKLKLREPFYVIVRGEVNHPDTLPFADGMHLGDVILLSGGLKDAASLNQIEVARRIKVQDYNPQDTSLAIVGRFSIQRDLKEDSGAESFALQPFDQIMIRHAPGYHEQIIVKIEGQVLYPGSYVLDAMNEKISDLIRKAGGFKPEAFPEGALLLRKPGAEGAEMAFEKNKLDVFASANKGDDSLEIRKIKSGMDSSLQLVGINLDKAIANPDSKYDLLLQKDDVIRVPRRLETVSLYGEVFYPKEVRFDKSYSFKDFISQAGGFTSIALKRGSYVVYSNGEVASTRKILFFNHYPKIKPGSEIFVPAKRQRQPLSTPEILGIFTGLATLAAILISVLK
jgi:protein involved in polysaccharide export with SLBB domain